MSGFINFISKYRIELDLRRTAVLKLKDVWECNSTKKKARFFFVEWYKQEPNDALRGLDLMGRKKSGGGGPFQKFVADMLDSIPSEEAIEVVDKFSQTGTKNPEYLAGYKKVINGSILKINEKNPEMVSRLLQGWESHGNDFQKSCAKNLRDLIKNDR